MQLSLSKERLMEYTSHQLNNIFPDGNLVNLARHTNLVDHALDRLNHCFKHVKFQRYNDETGTKFNHLYSDHYLMYIWFLANSIWKAESDLALANKLYYLNKALHSLDCMYDTKLPDIFLLFHSSGTMLGKANYADFFVALQGCTVGSQKGEYPTFGKGVALTANSSVIGNCNIGNRCTISTRTTIFQKNIPDEHTAFINFDSGQLQVKQSKECYAQQFFNINLNTV
ncbi:MAG: serine acetyltransferase [Chitinophagaceae bacterium]|nr:MAG: serine acetyltransferase [Chitinophagaceae bacterium]